MTTQLFGEHIFTELSVEHQLVAAYLSHLRSRSQLIEEEDALAGAAGAPDVKRHTFANERMKRLMELRWFHEGSSMGLKCAGINFWSRAMTGAFGLSRIDF